MKKFLIFLVVVVILGLGFWVYWLNTHPKEKIVEKENTIIDTRESWDRETIASGLKDIGKLVTQEYYFTHVEKYESDRSIDDFILPFTKNGFIYSYDGTITAGVDFTQAEVKVNKFAKKIEVTLPVPEIIGGEVDPDSRVIYDETNNIINPIDLDTVLRSYEEMLADEKAKALDRGILDKARKNAKNMLGNFLTSVTNGSDYKVIVMFADEVEQTEQTQESK